MVPPKKVVGLMAGEAMTGPRRPEPRWQVCHRRPVALDQRGPGQDMSGSPDKCAGPAFLIPAERADLPTRLPGAGDAGRSSWLIRLWRLGWRHGGDGFGTRRKRCLGGRRCILFYERGEGVELRLQLAHAPLCAREERVQAVGFGGALLADALLLRQGRSRVGEKLLFVEHDLSRSHAFGLGGCQPVGRAPHVVVGHARVVLARRPVVLRLPEVLLSILYPNPAGLLMNPPVIYIIGAVIIVVVRGLAAAIRYFARRSTGRA